MKHENDAINVANRVLSNSKFRSELGERLVSGSDKESIYYYFLKENADRFLGSNVITPENIEGDQVMTLKDSMSFVSNGLKLTVSLFDSEYGKDIYGKLESLAINENETSEFQIINLGDSIINNLEYNNGEVSERKTYKVDTKTFNYKYSISMGEDRSLVNYSGELNSINCKSGNKELFQYTRLIPKSEVSKSLLKKVVDSLKTNNIIAIETTIDPINCTYFVCDIFDKLKDLSEEYIIKEKNKQLKMEK